VRDSDKPSSFLSKAVTRASLLSLAALLTLSARTAAADVEIGTSQGWTLSTDGRINAFLSVARGDAIPDGEQNYTGLDEEATPGNKIESARVRTGFITSVLGLTLKKTLQPNVTAEARVGLWMLASSQRNWGDEPAVDAREAYFKIDAPWGGFLAGRAMSLFSRGAIMLDYDLEHNYGLGHPCSTKVVSGGACGHSGFGILFPGFHAGLVYNTPELAGLQLSAGLFDPDALAEGAYRRTPLPRAEAELTFKVPDYFRLFAGTLWQRVSRNNAPLMPNAPTTEQTVDAAGVSYGLMATLGPVGIGGSGYYGKGLGLYTPLEDNPINVTASGALRKQNGYYGAASLTILATKIAAGAGISRLERAVDDPPDSGASVTPKQQFGLSAGIYQGLYKTVIVALEYFRAQTTWYDRGMAVPQGTAIIRPVQTVNFINAGATLVW
jgi:porin-like protein